MKSQRQQVLLHQGLSCIHGREQFYGTITLKDGSLPKSTRLPIHLDTVLNSQVINVIIISRLHHASPGVSSITCSQQFPDQSVRCHVHSFTQPNVMNLMPPTTVKAIKSDGVQASSSNSPVQVV